jgi:sphingomyelin phosphodiesterase
MKLLSILPVALLAFSARPAAAGIIEELAQKIIDLLEEAVECGACKGVLEALKGGAELGDGIFVDVLSEVCKLSGAEDDDVCDGLISSEGPIIAHDLRNMDFGSHTAEVLCANLVGLCDYPAPRPYTIEFPKSKPNKTRPAPSSEEPIQVVHITDTHVDLSYTEGANFNCTKPICCRPYTEEDAPGNTSNPAGPWGNHQCDPPLQLESSMMDAINSLVNPAFTIQTGDVPAHDVWLVNQEEVTDNLETTYAQFQKLTQVFPSVGNHDTAPSNAFPSLNNEGADNPQWTYDIMASSWQGWLGSDGDSVSKYGAYSAKYKDTKLRIISFNSIFYYTLNFWMYTDPMEYDPSGQLEWMVQELQAAEDADERVWLIAHVPTGSSDFFHDYSQYMDQIINRYEATIAAMFFGHTHQDHFEISYSDYNSRSAENAIMMAYIAPSMTPTSGSPAFRSFSVDPVTFAVLDYTQYFANISDPAYQSGPQWAKYYSAKETYGPLVSPPLTDASAELTPSFWHEVVDVLADDDTEFQDYYMRKSRGYDTSTCTGDCKSLEICGLRAANSNYNCVVTTPGLSFGKREGSGSDHIDECGESRLRRVFRAFSRRELEYRP